jgi:hypothetical protein
MNTNTIRHPLLRVSTIAAATITTASALSSTLHVPGEYATVQEAIDAAAAGDEVVLAAGTYTDSFMFKEDHVVVRSAEGPSNTIIDGSGAMAYALAYFPPFSSGELHGVTFRNHDHPYTGAVTIKRCVATVADCIFEDNRNYFAGSALRIDSVSLGDTFEVEVVGCTFRRNESQCTFRNGSGDEIAGMRIVNEGIQAEGFNDVDLLDCTFEDHDGIGVHVQGEVHLTLDGGTFRNTGSPTVTLLAPASAEVSATSFCGNGVHMSGVWTDLGGNTFDSACPCPGDGSGDGVVDVHDLLAMIAAFGTDDDAWDFDQDGLVGVNDLLVVIAAWGEC